MDNELKEFFIKAAKRFYPKGGIKIILFGSRIKEDIRRDSDYDVAFGAEDRERLSELFAFINDNVPTLSRLDLIDLNDCQESLKNEIYNTGVIIYES